jgi:hypothetical protein
MPSAGKTKGGSITVPFTSCLTGLDYSVLQIKTEIINCHTAFSKPVKQEDNSTLILPPLVFPVECLNTVCRDVYCHAKCRHAGCHYVECRGASFLTLSWSTLLQSWLNPKPFLQPLPELKISAKL